MKIIIPMAGMGKRMRPHTLTIPKPLIPIAGKPIVQRLIEEIATVSKEKITEIGFVVGNFGSEVEQNLINIAKNIGAEAKIYYQTEALGTAHAIYCAKDSLSEKVIVAFADTLFKADFIIEDNIDAGIWVKKVDNPSSFGVVKLNNKNIITDFIEKPKTFVSDLAIIGIYYFKDAEKLKTEIKNLIDNNYMVNGEFQLTDALENMKNKGINFVPKKVIDWMDCGNKDATVETNTRILDYHKTEDLISKTAIIENSIIVPPCFIGKNAKIRNSVVGPYVSVGSETCVKHSIVKNSIIQRNSSIESMNLANSMVGNYVVIRGETTDVSIGDYTSMIK
jgi:glucose-1-phosphate thymidylyltransferase